MAYALMRFQRFFIHPELISVIHAPVLAAREISGWPRKTESIPLRKPFAWGP
jgi:hypothetical protein